MIDDADSMLNNYDEMVPFVNEEEEKILIIMICIEGVYSLDHVCITKMSIRNRCVIEVFVAYLYML